MEPNTETMDTDDSFQPFTIPERIKQLNEIDKKIAQIMQHTSTAMSSLKPTNPPQSIPAQKQSFQESMDAFISTLHFVDVHMKRQILGLEEAGIIDLSNDRAGAEGKEGGSGKADVKPTAVGTVGGLDVGWLNSRRNRVERDMEAELWTRGREFLEKATAVEDKEKEGQEAEAMQE